MAGHASHDIGRVRKRENEMTSAEFWGSMIREMRAARRDAAVEQLGDDKLTIMLLNHG